MFQILKVCPNKRKCLIAKICKALSTTVKCYKIHNLYVCINKMNQDYGALNGILNDDLHNSFADGFIIFHRNIERIVLFGFFFLLRQ